MAFDIDKQIDELPIHSTEVRLHYNKKILEILAQKIEENPELRFGQLLATLNIIQYRPANSRMNVIDPFYVESKDTWENMHK